MTTSRSPAHDPVSPLGGAVICVPDDETRSQIATALESAGFQLLAETDRGIELLPAVVDFAPDVVVLDLALVGSLGLHLFELIKNLGPRVAIIALAPLRTFDVAVLEAGAQAVVPIDDLRRLRQALGEISAQSVDSESGTRSTNAPPS